MYEIHTFYEYKIKVFRCETHARERQMTEANGVSNGGNANNVSYEKKNRAANQQVIELVRLAHISIHTSRQHTITFSRV